jgi:hypothetical protein
MPVPGTVSSVRSQKLLKPRMWIFFSFSMLTPDQQNTNGITEVGWGPWFRQEISPAGMMGRRRLHA